MINVTNREHLALKCTKCSVSSCLCCAYEREMIVDVQTRVLEEFSTSNFFENEGFNEKILSFLFDLSSHVESPFRNYDIVIITQC